MGRWLNRVLGREDERAEVEREIAFHLEMRRREYEAAGMTAEDAKQAAERSFGAVEEIMAELRRGRKDRGRQERWRSRSSGWLSDSRLAMRTLGRSPVFLVAVLLTLGTGIALTVTTASVLNAYLLQSMPYPEADRLVLLQGEGAPDWQTPPREFARAASWDLDALSIVSGGTPERVWTSWISPGLFDLLGVRPAHGRFFTDSEAGAGGASVAVISHDLWQRRWGGDPGVLGQTFAAYSDDRPDDAEVFTIVGVLPQEFWYFNRFTEVLAPLRVGRPTYIALLAPGVTSAVAADAVRRVAREEGRDGARVQVIPMHEEYVQTLRPTLYSVAGAVLLVFLIACGNAAVLLIVRASAREREFAVRAAIGAGRGRISRQLIVEGLVLSMVAAGVGMLLAAGLLASIRHFVPLFIGAEVPGGAAALRIDAIVLTGTVFVTTLVGVFFGMIPMIAGGRPDLSRALTEGARGMEARRGQRLRSALVTAELALSLALLVGAGLLIRSAGHLQGLQLGFRADGVMAMPLSLRERSFGEPADRAAFWDALLERVQADVPGASVALVNWAPFSRVGGIPIDTPEQPAPDSGGPTAMVQVASDEYFGVMEIALQRGRTFDERDQLGGLPVAVISQSLGARLWPNEDPLGRQLRVAARGRMNPEEAPEWSTVIGIVDGVRKTLTLENPPDLYMAMAQEPSFGAELIVRDPAGRTRVQSVRDAVWRLNPEVPLNEVRWIEDDVRAASLPSRFLASLLTAFAVFAVLLASMGLYGVVAYGIERRRRDIAIRMALGADRGRVLRMLLAEGARLVGLGLLAGLAGAFALSSILRSQLYGISRTDPLTYVLVAIALILAAFAATFLPAHRATRSEPMRELQSG
jgi:predicted permease